MTKMIQQKLPRAVLTILTVVPLFLPCIAEQQKFRLIPGDLVVSEGAEALLRCEIHNAAGSVQWTKDGFALGFTQSIPGYPRYSVLGDSGQGIYNLRIVNVTLEDDAEYQCQVGPYMHHKLIRAKARLTVIAPPTSIQIQGYSQHAKVEVREGEELTLTCVVPNARPAAQIVWYRANVEYKSNTIETKSAETEDHRYTATSKLQLQPTAEDDYIDYTCQARHQAIPEDRPMQSTVQLSVLYPPGVPYIEGYAPGEVIRRGQHVQLACRSRGGNPPAQLIWYKNGNQARMAYRTTDRFSENIYAFVAEASDNKARLRCEANNKMATKILKAEIILNVLFAPTQVIVSGPSEARVGDSVALQCQTTASNPAAEIKWVVNGKQVTNASSKVVPSPEGGWVTTSNITATVEASKRSLVAICHGVNMQLPENVQSTHTVNVLLPPGPPIISGYTEGSIITVGTRQKIMCTSSGGNPLATLVWYKNDKKIKSVSKTTDQSVSAELSMLANVTDNQAQYRCEAHNSATEIPLFETKVLTVHFAPETAKIRIEPAELRPGIEATLICDSSSSNPPAKLSWRHEGTVLEGTNNSSKAGLWGGTVSSLELKLNITQDMDGHVYTCQSTNEMLQRSINVAVNLPVLYEPRFQTPAETVVHGVAGEPLTVALVATGNPSSIAYTWTKNGQTIASTGSSGEPRIVSEGPILNITKLERTDAGVYTCEAVNSQGSAMINITLQVKYAATIKAISEHVTVDPGEDAILNCTVDGNPLTPDHIRWERDGYDLRAKTTTGYANGTGTLVVKDAQREDVGNFRCIADNRVAAPESRNVLLIVKFAPEIDKSPAMLRAASGPGDQARLPCRAKAAPAPIFHWIRTGQELPINQSSKYYTLQRQLDPLTHESILVIERISSRDYGDYECRAKNELGSGSGTGRLDVRSAPDSPATLTVLNVTHDSVTLGWEPGFDGGHRASYRIRYREATSERYRYEDGPPNAHQLTVAGLRSNTLYLFSIMAANVLGESRYLPDLTRAQTKERQPQPPMESSSFLAPSSPAGPSTLMLLGIGVAAGIALVLLNILLIGFCLYRRSLPGSSSSRRARHDHKYTGALYNSGDSSNPNSKSATIEMYAPSSYNDTVTGETLSSVSEKSDAYSNDGSQPDFMDETRKRAVSTYLIDGGEMQPPRYQQEGNLPHYASNTGTENGYDQSGPTDQLKNSTMDGSYYHMNNDRFYPPMDYPGVEFPTPPLPILPSVGPTESSSETLRRVARTMVPPPDVTHHTHHRTGGQQHDSSSLSTTLPFGSLNASISQAVQSTPKQPQGILKDPKRSNSSASGSHTYSSLPLQQQQQLYSIHNPSPIPSDQYVAGPSGYGLMMDPQGHVGTSAGSSLLMGAYDPPASSSLASYNVSVGYTDSDGHLV
ncbi:nephrin isoform X1 [Anopheles gambiae]|uniref:nephrin isoform X1 n=1 Tax=Anopheles gambiae TaxID=7165 RepID=UPI002AC9206E|nr:nephrin isoform X1 [Anopheles gambiae]XP_061513196.1 nephrin isoform X1 [Anopheles gambiae]XP_061513197.1 nephrin isoform X1 [Anopheles gambiae]XP_061513198.1 nephrin isoform X1 [Anopheles gambiae]